MSVATSLKTLIQVDNTLYNNHKDAYAYNIYIILYLWLIDYTVISTDNLIYYVKKIYEWWFMSYDKLSHF